jgi:polyhydroxybutyrate depolymerase
VSGLLADVDLPEGFPTRPVSLVAVHGRQDGVYDALNEGVAAWRRQVGCLPPLASSYGTSGRVVRLASRCRDGTDVVVYELADMGHARPAAAGDGAMAAPDAPESANELLWEFFAAHPRRR